MSTTTAEKIAIMQAFEDGEEVQRYSKHYKEWVLEILPLWNWCQSDYRIKPQPKVIWVNEYEDGDNYGYDTLEGAKDNISPEHARTLIKYVEVMEDE